MRQNNKGNKLLAVLVGGMALFASCDQMTDFFDGMLGQLGLKEAAAAPAPAPSGPASFAALADVDAYLDGVQNFTCNIPLAIGADYEKDAANTWEGLLKNIAAACATTGKTVDLDIAATTLATDGDGVFDPRGPDGSYNTGERYIASLVLPEAAVSMAAGQVFSAFSGLEHVSAAGVTALDAAFTNHPKLKMADFPRVTTIGANSFIGCRALLRVNFPAVEEIGQGAFNSCTALLAVSLPAAARIGDHAFSGCTVLIEANLPAAAEIGASAFASCGALLRLALPAIPPKLADGGAVFAYTGSTGRLEIKVPTQDAMFTYLESPDWSASGTKYGSNHKTIAIVYEGAKNTLPQSAGLPRT